MISAIWNGKIISANPVIMQNQTNTQPRKCRTPFYVDRFDYNYRDGQWSGTAHLRTMFGRHGLENPED